MHPVCHKRKTQCSFTRRARHPLHLSQKLPRRYKSFAKPISEGVGSSPRCYRGHSGPVWTELCLRTSHTCGQVADLETATPGVSLYSGGAVKLGWGPWFHLPVVYGCWWSRGVVGGPR